MAYSGFKKFNLGFNTKVNSDDIFSSSHTLFLQGNCDKVNFKAKLDTEKNVSLYTQYKMSKQITLQSSLGANLGDCSKNGFLGNPFKFGFRLKFSN